MTQRAVQAPSGFATRIKNDQGRSTSTGRISERKMTITVGPTATTPAVLKDFRIGIRITWIICYLGLFYGLLLWLGAPPGTFQSVPNAVSFYLFYSQDTVWLGICCLAIPLFGWLGSRLGVRFEALINFLSNIRQPVLWLSLSVLVVVFAGVGFVYHGYALSLDEFAARFQAQIFSAGHMLASVQAEWAEFTQALQPLYIAYDPVTETWASGYRPLGAALIALFDLFGMGKFASAGLAGACVILVADIARRVWPGERMAAPLAAFMLVASLQFVAMALDATRQLYNRPH